jgi:hypothetical protein
MSRMRSAAVLVICSLGSLAEADEHAATCVGGAAPSKHELDAPCDFFNHHDQATCCSKSSNQLIRRTFAAFEFNFDKCLSCQWNW